MRQFSKHIHKPINMHHYQQGLILAIFLLLTAIHTNKADGIPSSLRWLSRYYTSTDSLSNYDRNFLNNFVAPPSFSSPEPSFSDNSECESDDCVEERLSDCESCFSDRSHVKICKYFINSVSSSPPSSNTHTLNPTPLQNIIIQTKSPLCAGIFLAITTPPYNLNVGSHDELMAQGFGYLLAGVLGDDLVETEKAEVVNTRAARSGAYSVPYRVKVSLRTYAEMRKEAVNKAMNRMNYRYEFSMKPSIVKVTRIGKFSFIVIARFKNFKEIVR